jgi:hypothetical protein
MFDNEDRLEPQPKWLRRKFMIRFSQINDEYAVWNMLMALDFYAFSIHPSTATAKGEWTTLCADDALLRAIPGVVSVQEVFEAPVAAQKPEPIWKGNRVPRAA